MTPLASDDALLYHFKRVRDPVEIEIGAVDYVVRPFDFEEIEQSFQQRGSQLLKLVVLRICLLLGLRVWM